MRRFSIVVFALLLTQWVAGQTLTLDLGVGLNRPSNDFTNPYSAKSVNGPTVDAGIRYMFKKKLGIKADVGFNRYGGDVPEFKANLTRVNAQIYYNVWDHLYNFQVRLPERLAIFLHAGPGMSFLKPLSAPFNSNTASNFNAIAGLAVHYGITDRLSVYVDASNIFNIGQKLAYEGNILANKTTATMATLTVGVAISINSNCYYCDQPEPGL